MTKGCFLDERFKIHCNSSSGVPKLTLNGTDLPVIYISVSYSTIYVKFPIAFANCGVKDRSTVVDLEGSPFLFSSEDDFVARGCSNLTLMHQNNSTVGGCLSICYENRDRLIASCSGINKTELPLLVYEFIPNGTLFQFLYDPNEEFPLTWEMRLRIAAEVAGAHSAASIAIFIETSSPQTYCLMRSIETKLQLVSVDQTHVTTLVQGTFGYLDPDFGVVLVELLIGQKPISFTRSKEQGRSLATYFLIAMEINCLFDILDPQVVKQGKEEDVLMVASLARSCLRLNGKERPTMKEVTMVLERIQKSENLIVQ
uniref:Wall-associated receptor kinase galacturonan-binding domain-containing protein n=1 Tax=Salix viminalis TaxID=40686 RepID=A0A6N2NJ64_SALVM